MEIVQTQIPIATNDWLKLDLNEVIECTITKQDVTSLKAIKKMPPGKDMIFAPFCILYGLEPIKCGKLAEVDTSGQVKNVSWHASALRVLSLHNFLTLHNSYEKDCLNDSTVLEVFECLNREELQIDKVTAFNKSLGNLIKWCQGTVAYHIITHPYKIRNERIVPAGSDLHEFAQRIDKKMTNFYAFKAFLLKSNKISKKTNFAFNLKHSKVQRKAIGTTINVLTNEDLEKIFLFLSPKEALEKKMVCKKWGNPVNTHWDSRLVKIVQDIEAQKVTHIKQLLNKLPALFEYGFFLNALQMLDSILFSNDLFMSRSHLEDIKSIKKLTEPMNNLFNAFLILLNEKPLRKCISFKLNFA